MKTVFLTGGGGAGTIAITKSLKDIGKYRIILGDMAKWAAGLKFADKSYVLPKATDKNFLNCIKKIIDEEKVDVFIPLVDEELLKAYELKRNFSNLKILLPSLDFIKKTLDKYSLITELQNCDVSYPKTFLACDNFSIFNKPFIIKPRQGRGSRNVVTANNKEQVSAYLQLFGSNPEDVLIQEKIDGKEFTVSVVVNSKGCILAIVPKEVIYKKGLTIAAVTRKIPTIDKLCRTLQEKMQANGPFNVQLILTKDGNPIIFEINPRYSTTTALTIESGVNEVALLIDDQIYNNTHLIDFKENLVMSRFYNQLYFEE